GERKVLLDRKGAATPRQWILEDAGDTAGAGGGAKAGHVRRTDLHLSFGGDHVAGQNTEQRRLAGAVRADDGDELALLDGEADAVQRLLLQRRAPAEGDLDVGNGD